MLRSAYISFIRRSSSSMAFIWLIRDAREMDRWLDNRAENSYLPFRRRERAMLRFRCMRTFQKSVSVHNKFPTQRRLQNRGHYKLTRAAALAEWRGLPVA